MPIETNKPDLDSCSTLNALAAEVHQNSVDKGFYDAPVSMATSCANLHGEVSELWEAFRDGKLDKPCDKVDKMVAMGLPPITCAAEELADVIIRALDTADYIGVDISEAVRVKKAYNATRPRLHGGKAA